MLRRFFSDQDNRALVVGAVCVAVVWYVKINWGFA